MQMRAVRLPTTAEVLCNCLKPSSNTPGNSMISWEQHGNEAKGQEKPKLSDDPLLLKRPAPAQLVTRKMTKGQGQEHWAKGHDEACELRNGLMGWVGRGPSNQRRHGSPEKCVSAMVHVLRHAQVRLRGPSLGVDVVILISVLSLVLLGLSQLLPEGAAPLVDKATHRRAVVALELGVMAVVVLIRLEMILPAAVSGSWGNCQVEETPIENKRRQPRQIQGREEGIGVVVQVLYRVHGEP
mmetsp:Transcript_50072/g.119654  ORF Transcript_50072/g.119654 Transcript_50072/m.119654 type:complete len:240 (+) Transcript_50072:83-802(+)